MTISNIRGIRTQQHGRVPTQLSHSSHSNVRPGPGQAIHNHLNPPSFHPEFVIVINHLLRLPEMLIVMKPGPRGGDVDVDGSMFYVFLFLLYISFP